MQKVSRFLLLCLSGLALVSLHEALVSARIIGTNPTGASSDTWCEGGRIRGGTTISTTEVCIDSSGDVIPTTTNVNQLGTSSLQWSDVETTNINSGGGNLTMAPSALGTINVGTAGTITTTGLGNLTGGSTFIVTGGFALKKSLVGSAGGATTGIFTSTTVPYNTPYEVLNSSGNAITIASTPSISTFTTAGTGQAFVDGSILVLSSTASVNINFQDNTQLSGSLLHLGASQRTITKDKTLTLIFDSAIGGWDELSYGNNN